MQRAWVQSVFGELEKTMKEETAEYLRLSYTAGSRIHHYNYFVKLLAVSVKAKHTPNLYDATIPLI